MTEFFRRLRERKMVQWALAYVAASFALIQILDIVSQRFGWPEQTIRLVIIAAALGFFVTIVLAWYHGERGAQRVTSAELLILALLLAIGGAALWRLAPRTSEGAAASNTGGPVAGSAADPRSIAVLPFVNMSGEKDNDYFSDGISEEILNVLASIPELRVAARTSSFSFRDGKHEAPEIAQELHVRMILEGSVRKQGDRARITAQLIDAASGYHVWSQTYDRDLKDIFAIQDEIAAAIAHELKVKMDGTDETALKKPRNLEANDFYLRGLALWQTRGEASLISAIENFKNAIAADAEFAEAYAGLALAYTILPDYSATHRLRRCARSCARQCRSCPDTQSGVAGNLRRAWPISRTATVAVAPRRHFIVAPSRCGRRSQRRTSGSAIRSGPAVTCKGDWRCSSAAPRSIRAPRSSRTTTRWC